MANGKLRLDEANKKLAGVCAGVAKFFGIDVTIVRLVWVLAVLFAGVGLLAYLILWVVMPKA